MTGWEKFQHYRDRHPVWIKVYTDLLSKTEYLELSTHRRGLLHGLWLEYARSGQALPNLNTKLAQRLGIFRVTSSDIEALNRAGFLEISASKPLASGYQDASPDLRGRDREEQALTTPPFETGENREAESFAERSRRMPTDEEFAAIFEDPVLSKQNAYRLELEDEKARKAKAAGSGDA